MLNDARERSVRYTVKKTSASSREPSRSEATFEKNSSTASKNERKESPRLAGATTALTVGAPHARRIELGGNGRPGQRERDVELGQEDLQRPPHPVGSRHGEAPDHRPADHHRASPERERLEHVGSAANAAVHD